jgi:tetratricopeptide (TPR) repeat protein
LRNGQLDDAILHLQESLKIKSNVTTAGYIRVDALAHNNLGNAFVQKGLMDEAIVHYRKAVDLQPDYADAEFNLGRALFQKGNIDEAIRYWQKTLSIHPADAEAHASLGRALLRKRLTGDGIAHAAVVSQLQLDIDLYRLNFPRRSSGP